ncbi:unnamed protein product, partial [Symbiodinium necroappetens]
MLENRTEHELTEAARRHLEGKLCGPPPEEWDAELRALQQQVPVDDEWLPFTLQEVQDQLTKMKTRSSVGPDGIGVSLLRALVDHDTLADDFLAIVTHVIATNATPDHWRTSLLALLAKTEQPQGPADLRPIAMSSALQQTGSQTCHATLRDMSKEWKIPLVIAKLDIRGAFDAINRRCVASYLVRKLAHCGLDRETRFLLEQLQSNLLVGKVPGADDITVRCTSGIRQGAPESAEIFALVLHEALEIMMEGEAWRQIGKPIRDLDAELLMYQDDLLLWDGDVRKLETKL